MKGLQLTRLKRSLGCIMLVLVLLISGSVAFATGGSDAAFQDATEGAEENILDFVILLDCSYSGGQNDREDLYVDACKNFIDKLPVQDVRVGVVSFGYQTKSYPDGHVHSDVDQVHELISLAPLDREDSSVRKAFKDTLQEAVRQGRSSLKSFTPIGHALRKGLDMLESGGSIDGNAVIILVSDGVNEGFSDLYSDNQSPIKNRDLIAPAIREASEHNWPICSILLNYSNKNQGEVRKASELVEQLGSSNGRRGQCSGVIHGISCSSPADVHVAFVKIFNYAYGLDAPDPVLISLPYTYQFTVPALVSETGIDVFGSNIEYVKITNESGDFSRSIDRSINERNLMTVVEPGSYSSVKLICPTEGNWTARIEGQGQAIAYISHSNLRELGLQMNLSANGKDLMNLTRHDIVSVKAFFSYKGIDIPNSSFYGETDYRPYLKISKADQNGGFVTVAMPPMNGSVNGGYSYDLSLKELNETGNLTLQIFLEHPMFHNGVKYSNTESLRLDPKPIRLIRSDTMTQEVNIRTDFEPIDLASIFENPDNDPIEYTVTCTNDRNAVFPYEIENDYLYLFAGPGQGDYQIEITARDPDVAEPLAYRGLELKVTDRPPEIKKAVDSFRLWTDKYSFQDLTLGSASMDLEQYFRDPDGLQLRFSFAVSDDENSGFVKVTQSGSMLTFEPLNQGDGIVTVSASDDASSISQNVRIIVGSGKSYFWETNWYYFAIGGAVLLALILLIAFLLRIKRVKGMWKITFEENGMSSSIDEIDIYNNTQTGKKRKFPLKDLLAEICSFTDDPGRWGTSVSAAFGNTGADSIRIKGVVRKSGCKLVGIPKKENVRVSCNGISGRTLNLRFGSLIIELDDESGDTLSITMELL